MLNITKNAENTALTICLEGRLDTTTAPQLEAEIKESLEDVTALTLDMEKLEYISSAGLRVLLSAQKTMNRQGEMKVIHVGETITMPRRSIMLGKGNLSLHGKIRNMQARIFRHEYELPFVNL